MDSDGGDAGGFYPLDQIDRLLYLFTPKENIWVLEILILINSIQLIFIDPIYNTCPLRSLRFIDPDLYILICV